MKRIVVVLYSLLFLCFSQNLKSQISLENTYNVSAGVAWLELSGTKYYVMDVANSQCRIYNIDHTLWKTMSFSLPANNYLYDIQYVTQNVFDQDSEVECLVTYYEYIDNGSTQYYEYTTVVYNEDLQVLLNVPGGGYSYVTTIENSYKMFVYVYDYSASPYTVSTRIYHLPGIISDISSPAAPLNEMSGMAFPNPSSSSVTIPYEISDFDGSAKLIVSDVSGKERRNILLNSAAGQVVVSGGDLHPGIYFYRIDNKGELGQARKFIIQ